MAPRMIQYFRAARAVWKAPALRLDCGLTAYPGQWSSVRS